MRDHWSGPCGITKLSVIGRKLFNEYRKYVENQESVFEYDMQIPMHPSVKKRQENLQHKMRKNAHVIQKRIRRTYPFPKELCLIILHYL